MIQITLQKLTQELFDQLVRRWLRWGLLVEAPPWVRLQVHFLRPFFRISGELAAWGPWIGFN